MLVLLDTSAYLRILRDAGFAHDAEPALRRIAPRLHLSSVVRAELTQGAKGTAGRALVLRIARRLEQVGRVVTPTHGDWVRAGTIQSMIWDQMPALRTKHLLNDLLIGAAARRIGACLVTDDERDFGIIDRWLPTRRLLGRDLVGL